MKNLINYQYNGSFTMLKVTIHNYTQMDILAIARSRNAKRTKRTNHTRRASNAGSNAGSNVGSNVGNNVGNNVGSNAESNMQPKIVVYSTLQNMVNIIRNEKNDRMRMVYVQKYRQYRNTIPDDIKNILIVMLKIEEMDKVIQLIYN